MIWSIGCRLLLALVSVVLAKGGPDSSLDKPLNNTADSEWLRTWWHGTGEINKWTVVQDGNVRQSHLYSVQVASVADRARTFYDSFVYETLPRNGHQNIQDPRDLQSITDDEDGISIERDIGLTMAWSQFLYSDDVYLRVTRSDGRRLSNSDVLLRPDSFGHLVKEADGALYIYIPYRPNGVKFSVEFKDDQFEFHNSCDGTSCALIQNVNPDGANYAESFEESNPVIATEPLNSLIVFASPFLQSNMIPDPEDQDTLRVKPGQVTGLDETDAKVVYFGPGVYWLGGTAHANLSSSVEWVHFEAGSYVKGAVQFNTDSKEMKATGHGVLSGEQYVYQANPAVGYTSEKSNDDCLRMWRGHSTGGVEQTFLLNGPTVNAPPFNSMDFTGDFESLSVLAQDYKQVGAFFAQTDGLQAYPNSHIHDVFYHSNDDTIKTYYSNVLVENVMVWKAHTAPIIQFGWASRNLTNVTVDNVDVIHSRWNTNGSHPSIIGGNQVYNKDEDQYDTAEASNTISNIRYSNIRAEGISGNLFRIMPLANIDNFVIENVSLHSFPSFSTGISGSQLVAMTDADGTPVTVKGFVVDNFSVNGTLISYGKGNWDNTGLGNLNIASDLKSGVDVVDGDSGPMN